MEYSVLTYIFDNYDIVREMSVKDPLAEYILVTDNKNLRSNDWTIVFDSNLEGKSVFDKCYYVRFHPFEYVNTNICIRIDGSIKIKESLMPIINAFNQENSDICLMSNPMFQYLHEDYAYWIANRGYPSQFADKCLKILKTDGYDERYKGYYQLCFCILRNNTVTSELNSRSYQLLKELGDENSIERFDQPVFSFIFNKYEGRIKVMMVDEYLITFSRYLQWYFHNRKKRIPYKIKMKVPYLFNHPVVCSRFDYLSEKGCFGKKLEFSIMKMIFLLKSRIKLRKLR